MQHGITATFAAVQLTHLSGCLRFAAALCCYTAYTVITVNGYIYSRIDKVAVRISSVMLRV